MTLPASGQLLMSQICTEFGAPATTPLSAFNRGGAWVPDTPANAAISTSPTALRMTQFYGASVAPALGASVIGGVFTASGGAPIGATARYSLTNGGLEQAKEGSAATITIGTWLLAGAVADYDVRVTITSGFLSSGSAGVWLNLATTREWTFLGTVGGGPEQCTFTVEVRPAGGGATLDSASVTLESEHF